MPAADRVRRCRRKGVVPYLDPLPRFEISQPGNVLRIFERGGRFLPEIGIPERLEDPGRPAHAAERPRARHREPHRPGLRQPEQDAAVRPDAQLPRHQRPPRRLPLQRLHRLPRRLRQRPLAGPLRAVRQVRQPRARASNPDPTIPKNEPGHPIEHRFTNGDPDQPVHGLPHPPRHDRHEQLPRLHVVGRGDRRRADVPDEAEEPDRRGVRSAPQMRNPDEAAARGNWSDPEFLDDVAELNPQMAKHTQFADFHGHGWVFRAVFKKDRKGKLLDHDGKPVDRRRRRRSCRRRSDCPTRPRSSTSTRSRRRAKQRRRREDARRQSRRRRRSTCMDIHLEKGMHCVDCHFVQDIHGNSRLHRRCGRRSRSSASTATARPTKYADAADQRPGGVHVRAGRPAGRNLTALRTPFGKRRFEVAVGEQASSRTRWSRRTCAGRSSRRRTRSPRATAHYNEKSHLAKTVRVRGRADGRGATCPAGGEKCLRPRQRQHELHRLPLVVEPELLRLPPAAEGQHEDAARCTTRATSRGTTSPYNFQTLRDDVYMLARDGDVTGNRINPARSSCAIHVGVVQRQPRVDLRPAADDLGRGLQRHRLQHERAAHGPRQRGARDEAVHRLPRLEDERQQRDHGPAADAGHQLS